MSEKMIENLKFERLGKEERKLLLTALDFDFSRLVCQMCKEKVSYQDCAIMPSAGTKLKATICCDSALCYTEYFEELEKLK